ncbi:MAG TPA: fibronectin type III domain-containing protein, partial [bacterium]|nr:fibronectin type III domain-containing protein [bacterium]
ASEWVTNAAPADTLIKVSSASACNGKVLLSLGYPQQKVTALAATSGAFLWQQAVGEITAQNFTSTPITIGDTVVAGTDAGEIIVFNAADGSILFRMSAGSGVAASPAAADGVVFIATVTGDVLALRGSDNTKPVVSITTPATGAVAGHEIVFKGTASDDNLESYKLEFGAGASPASWTEIATVSGASVQNGTLATWKPSKDTASGDYTVRLTAIDTAANSDSASVGFTLDNTPPVFAGIKNLIQGSSANSAILSWDAAQGSDTSVSYRVYSASTSGAENFASEPTAITNDTSTTISNLEFGSKAYFVVRAADSFGNEDDNTIELGFTAKDNAAPVFSGIGKVTDAGTGDSLILTWNAADDNGRISEYRIFMAKTPGGEDFGSPIKSVQGNNAVVTGLETGKQYYFVVRAIDSSGNEETNTTEKSGIPTTQKPALVLTDPPGDVLTNLSSITVSGDSRPGYTISIGGNSGAVSEAGTFAVPVALNPGRNSLEIVAKDGAGVQMDSTVLIVDYQPDSSGFTASEYFIAGSADSQGAGKTVMGSVPISIRVFDAARTPIYAAAAAFSVFNQPEGAKNTSLSPADARTGADGTASTSLSLGDKAGIYTITADITDAAGNHIKGSPLTFRYDAAAPSRNPAPALQP